MCTPPRSGVWSAKTRPTGSVPIKRAGSLLMMTSPTVPCPRPSRGTCGQGLSVPATEAQREDLGAELVGGDVDRSRLVVGPPGLLHHDHVGVEACAAR